MKKEEKLKTAKIDEFMTVEEAADKLGIKPMVVRNYLYQGKFVTYKFKTLTLLKSSELENWKKRQEAVDSARKSFA